MKLCGFQKLTLLDYPGHMAATVFTDGCSFRCPFCHNQELLTGDAPALFSEEVFAVLKKRQHILEGVCITGGEPTLSADLEDFIRKIRSLGLSVKLDTNGYQPKVLGRLLKAGLLDMVAMDIKSSPERYGAVAGVAQLDISRIEESLALLKGWHTKQGGVYELRTTVVKELHTLSDFERIGPWISGAPAYYLQGYVDSELRNSHDTEPVHRAGSGFHCCEKAEMLSFLEAVRPYVGYAALRGVD